MIYFGVSVALDGLLNLILIFALHREIKRVKKFIKSNGEDFTDYEVKQFVKYCQKLSYFAYVKNFGIGWCIMLQKGGIIWGLTVKLNLSKNI